MRKYLVRIPVDNQVLCQSIKAEDYQTARIKAESNLFK
jgi:hypothetical protein